MGAQVLVQAWVLSADVQLRVYCLCRQFFKMLDLMTLISTMGVQQELDEAQRERKANLVIREEEGEDSALVEQAADSLSSAFEGFESALSDGVSCLFGALSASDAAPADTTAKKVV